MKIDYIDVLSIELEIRPDIPDDPASMPQLHQRVVFKVSLDNGGVGFERLVPALGFA